MGQSKKVDPRAIVKVSGDEDGDEFEEGNVPGACRRVARRLDNGPCRAARVDSDGYRAGERGREILEAAVGAKYLHAADRAQTWIARNMRILNDALWAGRPRDTCVACAERALGLHPKVAIAVSVRERDKSSDWKTVK